MITLFKKYKKYPFVEEVSIYDIGSNCMEGECMNDGLFKRKLDKLFLNNFCEFHEIDFEFVGSSNNTAPIAGEIIKGVVTNINVDSFFDIDCTVKFTVDGKEYEVYVDEPTKIYLKEKRKKIEYDKTVDPYGEEDWDD